MPETRKHLAPEFFAWDMRWTPLDSDGKAIVERMVRLSDERATKDGTTAQPHPRA